MTANSVGRWKMPVKGVGRKIRRPLLRRYWIRDPRPQGGICLAWRSTQVGYGKSTSPQGRQILPRGAPPPPAPPNLRPQDLVCQIPVTPEVAHKILCLGLDSATLEE